MYFSLRPLAAEPLIRHKGRHVHYLNSHLVFLALFELAMKSCIYTFLHGIIARAF